MILFLTVSGLARKAMLSLSRCAKLWVKRVKLWIVMSENMIPKKQLRGHNACQFDRAAHPTRRKEPASDAGRTHLSESATSARHLFIISYHNFILDLHIILYIT